MAWSDEAEQGLPPQRHREPAALRQEILEELTDHLAFAAERESESGVEDEAQIRARVLKKFGNPAAVARSLWWGAMKETVMKDWIQISINAIICISVVTFMAIFYRQMQSTNTALISALNDRPSAAEELYPSVEFILHRGSIDGPLAEGIQLRVNGRAFNEQSDWISEESDGQGRAVFGPIRAGQYKVNIWDEETGLGLSRQITLYSGEGTKTVRIPVPPAEPVLLDTTAPFGMHVADENFRILASMQVQWSHEGDLWDGDQPGFVIVTPEGIFQARTWPTSELIEPVDPRTRQARRKGFLHDEVFQGEERIAQTYGNRLSFSDMNIAESHYPEESCEACFMLLKATRYPYRSDAEVLHDLRPDESNALQLDVPGELLRAYEYYVRWKANTDNGLPDRFSWFPDWVSEEYTDFVVDEARLVEQGLGFDWVDNQYTLRPGARRVSISGESAQVFSLTNAPKSLPDGYRLLLALRDPVGDLGVLNDNLCAYLDTSPASFDLEHPVEDSQFPNIDEPVWKLDANTLAAKMSQNVLFVDLTDATKDDEDFERATGLLFKWEGPSKNALHLRAPAASPDGYQPVWLIMKPFGKDSAADAN